LLAGCGPGIRPPVYQDDQGIRFTPPPGWVERARPDAVAGARGQAQPRGRAHPHVPLPPLGGGGGPAGERLLARYDRLTAGRLAWLRLTAADVPPSASPAALLTGRGPGPDWRREADVERLEVGGLPAARVAWSGRWENQAYLNETVAVRKGERVYFVTASFPAADGEARARVRQAVAGAVWN
jgi:hypothetical protein